MELMYSAGTRSNTGGKCLAMLRNLPWDNRYLRFVITKGLALQAACLVPGGSGENAQSDWHAAAGRRGQRCSGRGRLILSISLVRPTRWRVRIAGHGVPLSLALARAATPKARLHTPEKQYSAPRCIRASATLRAHLQRGLGVTRWCWSSAGPFEIAPNHGDHLELLTSAAPASEFCPVSARHGAASSYCRRGDS